MQTGSSDRNSEANGKLSLDGANGSHSHGNEGEQHAAVRNTDPVTVWSLCWAQGRAFSTLFDQRLGSGISPG